MEVSCRPHRPDEREGQDRDVGVAELAFFRGRLAGGDARGPACGGTLREKEDLAGGAADVEAGDQEKDVGFGASLGEVRLALLAVSRAALLAGCRRRRGQRCSTAGPLQRWRVSST